ncbi:hypothetical protein [Novipirellula rosea]|uniref:Membrane protein n=1 Tax=Novipirellula rosea TaxID=1031540 RepID=A0ABP8NF90_9BACT|tara:strand:+ start:919 stop:1428 length:510 start_codon:yes stop_codon:yes gene_type:complete
MTAIPPQPHDNPFAQPTSNPPPPRPSSEDIDQLRLLSIFHYVAGGILALISLFPIIHVVIGIAIVSGALDDANANGSPSPAIFGWFFILFPALMIGMGMAMACCVIVAGRKLGSYQGYTYCLVIAGVECMFMPFGTVLGVLTILVLMRPSVKALFGYSASSASVGGGQS